MRLIILTEVLCFLLNNKLTLKVSEDFAQNMFVDFDTFVTIKAEKKIYKSMMYKYSFNPTTSITTIKYNTAL